MLYVYLKEGNEEKRDRHFTVVLIDNIHAIGRQLKYTKFHLNIIFFLFCEGGQTF